MFYGSPARRREYGHFILELHLHTIKSEKLTSGAGLYAVFTNPGNAHPRLMIATAFDISPMQSYQVS